MTYAFRRAGLAALCVAGLGSGALTVAGCVEEEAGQAPPLDAPYFPTSVALTPDTGAGRLLLVVSSNFDLRYRSGVLHAFALEAVDALADAAPPPSDCPAGPDGAPSRCRAPEVPELASAARGAVEIGDFGGQVAVADTGAGLRAFVAVRGGDVVVPVEVAPDADAVLACSRGGGSDCRSAGVDFPGDDPYAVAVIGPNVFVTHVSAPQRIGVVAGAPVASPIWSEGAADLRPITLGGTGGGGLAGRCRSGAGGVPDCSLGGTVYVSGRSVDDGLNPLYAFDFGPDTLLEGPIHVVNVYYQQRGIDARGLALASDGPSVYLATRSPDAVATVDVSELGEAPPDGCVDPAGVGGDGFVCPASPATGDRETAPRFATARLSAVPTGPGELAVIPRALPDGTISDLLAVTTSASLAFVDTRTGRLAGEVRGLGSSPSALAHRALPDGRVRFYVPSFGEGTLAVVDVDPFRPTEARLVARLGIPQEGGF